MDNRFITAISALHFNSDASDNVRTVQRTEVNENDEGFLICHMALGAHSPKVISKIITLLGLFLIFIFDETCGIGAFTW